MSAADQLALTQLYPCATCGATGRVEDRETGEQRVCPTCQGAATVEFDPDDHSEIPF